MRIPTLRSDVLYLRRDGPDHIIQVRSPGGMLLNSIKLSPRQAETLADALAPDLSDLNLEARAEDF